MYVSTPETNKRISQKLKMSGRFAGSNNPAWKGGMGFCSDCGGAKSTKRAIRCRRCQNKFRMGINHPHWVIDRNAVLEKHRVRSSVEWKEWRAAVFARDEFTCKECGANGVYLEPHHIVPVRSCGDKLFDINNGITLCRPCHKKTLWKEDEFAEHFFAILTKVSAYCS